MVIEDMLIRKIKKEDITAIAAIHKDVYSPDHFSTKFSLRMLVKYYYEICKQSQFSFVITEDGNTVIGFLIADYARDIKKAKRLFQFKSFFSIVFLLLNNPQLLLEIIKERFKKLLSKIKLKSRVEMRLISLAISKKNQNRSLGKLLLDTFENHLKINNITLYGLSVKKSNAQAIRFYMKNGFVEEYTSSQLIWLMKKIL